MAEITPLFMYDFQRNLNLRFSNAWKRTLAGLWWKSVAITQSSSTLEELYEWMLETAEIRKTNSKGTELDFEDLVAVSHRIAAENAGTGLKLNRNSIEDNKYDRAAKWSADAGSAGAYWPQRQIVTLIQQGKTKKAYDGKNFFAADHPVNPFDATLGNYSNLITNKPLSAANVGAVMAQIMTIKHPGNAPRNLVPSILAVDPSNMLLAQQITGAEIISDPTSGATNPAGVSNMVKRAWNFGQPLVVPEFATEPGVWYVGIEADEDAFDGAFIYQERKAFEMNSYTAMTQAELDRLNEFEWHLRGRNTAAYGHPYLFFRVEPS